MSEQNPNERYAAMIAVETAQRELWVAARDADRTALPPAVREAAEALSVAEVRWARAFHTLTSKQRAALDRDLAQEAAQQAVQAALVAVGVAAGGRRGAAGSSAWYMAMVRENEAIEALLAAEQRLAEANGEQKPKRADYRSVKSIAEKHGFGPMPKGQSAANHLPCRTIRCDAEASGEGADDGDT